MAMPEYQGKHAVVNYDDKVCIHAGECVKGLPAVFDVNQKPWVNPDGASVAELEAVIARCPSGALSLKKT
jgi:uncharacterized Fe-S cluster protein YjdI